MTCTQIIVIAGCLFGSTTVSSIVWAQPTHQVAPTANGTAIVQGYVLDGQTKAPIAGATVMAKNQAGAIRDQQITNSEGAYQLKLDPKQSYIFTAKADGYITLDEQLYFSSPTAVSMDRSKNPTLLYRTSSNPVSKSSVAPAHTTTSTVTAPPAKTPVTTPPVSEQPAVSASTNVNRTRVTPPKTLDAKVTYTPPPIVAAAGKTTQLQTLQFVQSKAELLPEAQPTLDQLLSFMQEHPTAEIELAGHTDNQGDFDENLRLSKQRVDVVKEYLVKNGIAANRISTRGYGPTRPIASNNSEVTRKLNRRVEMTVLKE
ncbi:OmpA family protein [Spirosoma gilvum]